MSTDMIDSQAAPRPPATDIQADKIGSFGLNQSSRPKKIRVSMKGNRDNFLNTLKKETECDHKILRYQITDQIMRKAAFHLRNGQHEVIIVLKSDFLGHLRMLVISENQKVTVRILVENGFVKDLIESNLHQLKADLQHQGLEVGKLEVRIACEPEASGHSQEKKSQWRAGQDKVRHQEHDNQKDEQQKENGPPPRTANNAATVDYFA